MNTTATFGKIVVGVDGSAGSRSALKWAMGEAAVRHVEIEAVFAWVIPALAYGAPGFVPPAADEMEQVGQQTVGEVVRDVVGDHHDVKIHTRAPEGRALDALRHIAEEPDVGLVVVGSRGHGGLAETLLGSVSRGLAHHCPVPLVIIPKARPEPSTPSGRIVVGMDGSPHAEAALQWAAQEAAARGSVLDVVVVGAQSAVAEREANEIVKATVARMSLPTISIQTTVIDGNPAEVLLNQAARSQLLVVGTPGRGWTRELIAGSVSQACAHRTQTPIVIVPAD